MSEFATIGGGRPVGFTLCGEQFRWRGVTPKQYSDWLGERNTPEGEEDVRTILTWSQLCEQADEIVLLGLYDESDRARYLGLREGALNGGGVIPTITEIIALRNWIMEVETGRPPLVGTPSSSGPGNDEDSSTDESGEPEVTPAA